LACGPFNVAGGWWEGHQVEQVATQAAFTPARHVVRAGASRAFHRRAPCSRREPCEPVSPELVWLPVKRLLGAITLAGVSTLRYRLGIGSA
jgi:hypothetical protein